MFKWYIVKFLPALAFALNTMAETKEVNPDTGAYTTTPTKDSKDVYGSADPVSTSSTQEPAPMYPEEEIEQEKKPWWNGFFVMGHVLQIITAAILAIALGIGISAAVDVPESARVIIGIPGDLWLRCLKAIGELTRTLSVQSPGSSIVLTNVFHSHPLDCLRHDPRCPAPPRYGR